jgi:hypothetical protein
LPIPNYRHQYENVSIEMLYRDEDLTKTDSRGRRLYFNNELEKRIAPDNSITYVIVTPLASREYKKKVFDGLAEQIVDETGNAKGLSKARFAKLIYNDDKEFQNVDFSAFAPIFKMINNILKDHV